MVKLSGPHLEHLRRAAKEDHRLSVFLEGAEAPTPKRSRSIEEARQCKYLGKGTGRMIEITSYG